MNDLSCDIRIWAQVSFVLSLIHAFDRLTDGRTERPWQYRALHYMHWHSKKVKYVFTFMIYFAQSSTSNR